MSNINYMTKVALATRYVLQTRPMTKWADGTTASDTSGSSTPGDPEQASSVASVSPDDKIKGIELDTDTKFNPRGLVIPGMSTLAGLAAAYGLSPTDEETGRKKNLFRNMLFYGGLGAVGGWGGRAWSRRSNENAQLPLLRGAAGETLSEEDMNKFKSLHGWSRYFRPMFSPEVNKDPTTYANDAVTAYDKHTAEIEAATADAN